MPDGAWIRADPAAGVGLLFFDTMNTSHLRTPHIEAAIATFQTLTGKGHETRNSFYEALDTLPEPPSSPPTLKPITDPMPDVAEGCQRIMGMWIDYGQPPYLCVDSGGMDPWRPDFYVDVALPTVDKDRQDFEAWWPAWSPQSDNDKERYYAAWQAARNSKNA